MEVVLNPEHDASDSFMAGNISDGSEAIRFHGEMTRQDAKMAAKQSLAIARNQVYNGGKWKRVFGKGVEPRWHFKYDGEMIDRCNGAGVRR